MIETFRTFFKASKTPFAIDSAVDPRPAAHWKHYRCDRHFNDLVEWLRSKGVKGQKPIHTLRKEFGSMVNQKFGIYGASAALRHSSISLTREFYVDRKERLAVDISELMQIPQTKAS
jgi:hypothetical protein